MRTLAVVLVMFLGCSGANAQQARMDRAERISKAVGLSDILAAAQASNLESVKQQSIVMLDQLRRVGVPDAELIKLTPAIDRLLVISTTSWDPKIAARIYAEGLVDELSEGELVEAERYYLSPEGIKANKALTSSQNKMAEYIQRQTAAAMEPAMASFFEEVKKVTQARKR